MEKNWQLNHLGFVVRDIQQARNYYERLGIATLGPERVMETQDGGEVKTCQVRIGPLEIEFLQPVDGEGPSSQFLKQRGEGINHLAFNVTDFDKEVERLVTRGVKLIFRTEDDWYGKVAYFDTGEIGGVLLELVQLPTSIKSEPCTTT